MHNSETDKAVYTIHESDIQHEAERVLGRKLTEEEMMEAVDALDWGIGESIGIIYHTIFTEILPQQNLAS
jgi:hypothetical protein